VEDLASGLTDPCGFLSTVGTGRVAKKRQECKIPLVAISYLFEFIRLL
jgi:hypothetical protein